MARLGDFFVLGVKFCYKVAQISHLFLGYFEPHHFLIKTVVATFLQMFEEFLKNGPIPASFCLFSSIRHVIT